MTTDDRSDGRLTRRNFLRTSALGAAGMWALAGAEDGHSLFAGTPERRPNVIMILADDMGYSDIGCYGSEIRTPNLDALAQGGVRFSQAYNTARCCPSRAALLTGLYPHQAGLGLMVANMGTPSYQGYLRDDCATVAEALRASGYQTWMTGKWHVGGNQAPDDPSTWHPGAPDQPGPLDRGFDRFFGTLGGAGSYFRPPILMDQDKFVTEAQPGFYYTQAIGDHACAMIRETAKTNTPFFGYVAFTAPHWPLHALPEDIEKYEERYEVGWDVIRAERYERQKALGLISPKWALSERDPRAPAWESLDPERRAWEARRMAVYAAMVDRLDQNVGRILAALDETGQRDNTIIIFLADNGGCEEPMKADGSNVKRYDLPMTNGGHPTMGNRPGLMPGPEDTFMSYDVSWANASNTPFREYKKWVHEGGIAMPLIVNAPGLAAHANTVLDTPCHNIDIMPTILEMAKAQPLTTRNGKKTIPLEGKSLVPTLNGQHDIPPDRALYWEHMGNRAVRVGAFKLVADNDRPWELYDLESDRTELKDLVAAMPEKAAELETMYDAWAKRVGVEDFDTLQKKNKKRDE